MLDPMMPEASELPPLPRLRPGRYRHYKGGEYEVVAVARHSETHEPQVVYRPLYNATGWWVRPHAMFVEDVVIDGVRQPRFRLIDGAADGIRRYDDARDRAAVIALWDEVFGYSAPHNAPAVSIDTKLAADDGLFFVLEQDGAPRGTVMAGWDGHRGWIYSVAVAPGWQRRGLGERLVRHAEQALAQRGCPKINLQILGGNERVVGFYERLGFVVEPRTSMGKRLIVAQAAGR